MADGELVELVIALDTRGPGAARAFVIACLERRVAAPALDSAQLLVSELVERLADRGTEVWAQLPGAGGVPAGGPHGSGSGLASRAA